MARLDRQYAETSRLEFPGTKYQTVAPVPAGDAGDGRLLAYNFFDHAALLRPDGKELWRQRWRRAV